MNRSIKIFHQQSARKISYSWLFVRNKQSKQILSHISKNTCMITCVNRIVYLLIEIIEYTEYKTAILIKHFPFHNICIIRYKCTWDRAQCFLKTFIIFRMNSMTTAIMARTITGKGIPST